MYLHMSHISSFSNNYASKLKLKDITLYNPIKQELSPKTFEREFPNVHYNWHIHVRTLQPSVTVSCRTVCAMHAVCTWFMVIQEPVSRTISARVMIG